MCGIVGLLARSAIAEDVIIAAERAIAYRGPDDEGHWLSEDGLVALGHRRLAIVDLSAAGHQPMQSADGRHVIVYNGEIYDHRDIRRELEASGDAPTWRGSSDTETLLAAIAAWGVDRAITRATGMFAFALWDRANRRLTLARDRFGEKPLYYGWGTQGFGFASELKALRTMPGFDNPVDENAVRLLLGYGCVPAPLTIHRRLFKLEPGTLVTVSDDIANMPSERPLSAGGMPGVVFRRYYDYAEVVRAGAANPFADRGEALDALQDAMSGAIARQMMADVPVGTFLSGGIDSSLVTALAARNSTRPVKTFSIGFADAGYDEAPFARQVAQHLGTDHHELYVTGAEAQAVIPQLPTLYDEPFADSSQLPTYLVSRFARSEVTVALTGDAGDELFGGYNRHIEFPALWRRAQAIPRPLRVAGLGAAGRLPAATWNAASRLVGQKRPAFFGHKVRRALTLAAGARDFSGLTGAFLDSWSGEAAPGRGSADLYAEARRAIHHKLDGLPLATQLMAADALTYLPDMILTKVDRAAMAVSLEGRVPFLDHDVAAVAARMPAAFNIAGGRGKLMLRELLFTMVPAPLFDRPKAGFAMPVGPWLRGPLRDWAESLLSTQALAESGLLDPVPIRQRWADHLSGRRDYSESLWYVLMLQGWLRR